MSEYNPQLHTSREHLRLSRIPSRTQKILGAGGLALTLALSGCSVAATSEPLPTRTFVSTSSPVDTFKPLPFPTLSPSSTVEPILTPTPKEIIVPELLPAYFLDWKPDDKAPKDVVGVVMHDYGEDIGMQYQPTTIAQMALAYYNRWLVDTNPTQVNADKVAFLTQTNWLISHQTSDGRWLFNFPWGSQEKPWWSGIAEGNAISALLRAYSMTGNQDCLTAISKARTTFERDISHNGVAAQVALGSESYVVLEEYLPGYQANVLNGWLFALIALYEEANYLQDPEASADLFGANSGIAALKALLPSYDTGFWSLYDMTNPGGHPKGSFDTVYYHHLIIDQLRYIAKITGDPFFSKYADIFQAYG